MSANLFWVFAALAVLGSIAVLATSIRTRQESRHERSTLKAMRAFFREQLEGIDRDQETGRISTEEATAARAEVAREAILALLNSARTSGPLHIRSRFYLAGELTRSGQYVEAVALWEGLLAIATGQEAWVVTAQSGLEAAQTGLRGNDVGRDSQAVEVNLATSALIDLRRI